MKSALIRCWSFHDTACTWVAPASNDVYSFSEWPAQRIWVNLSESHRGFWQFLAVPGTTLLRLRSTERSIVCTPFVYEPSTSRLHQTSLFRVFVAQIQMQAHLGQKKSYTPWTLSASSVSCELHILKEFQSSKQAQTQGQTMTNPSPGRTPGTSILPCISRPYLGSICHSVQVFMRFYAMCKPLQCAVLRCILDILVARTGSSEIANLKELLL